MSEERRSHAFVANIYFTVLLSLSSLLGALSLPFFDSPVFSGIALSALCVTIFFVTRERLPLCAIVLPALLCVWLGGGFGVPSVFVGFIISVSSSAYLLLGSRRLFVLITAVLAFAIAALIRSPLFALLTLLPFALGAILALSALRTRLSVAVSIGSLFILLVAVVTLVIYLALRGESVGAFAEAQRVALCDFFTTGDVLTFDRDSAAELSSLIIECSPSLFFALGSAVLYLSHSLLFSVMRSSGMEDALTTDNTRLSLTTPTAAAVCISFLFLVVFEALENRLACAVLYNIIFATLLPLVFIGIRTEKELLSRFVFKNAQRPATLSAVLVIIFTFLIPMLAIPLHICTALLYTLKPVFLGLAEKIKSNIQK
jgi:hypothetical protein